VRLTHPIRTAKSPSRKGGKRILLSLAREWFRITNGLLIIEDPEPAPNKLMGVNVAERRKVVNTRTPFGLGTLNA